MMPTSPERELPTAAMLQARAAVVNRTHRVVRQRAADMQAQKRRVRDLVVPFLICSVILWLMAHAVWSVTDQSLAGLEGGVWKLLNNEGMEAGSTFSMLLIWFLPLSVVTAAVILFRRSRAPQRYDEVVR